MGMAVTHAMSMIVHHMLASHQEMEHLQALEFTSQECQHGHEICFDHKA